MSNGQPEACREDKFAMLLDRVKEAAIGAMDLKNRCESIDERFFGAKPTSGAKDCEKKEPPLSVYERITTHLDDIDAYRKASMEALEGF